MYTITDAAYELLKRDVQLILDGCMDQGRARIQDQFGDSYKIAYDKEKEPHLYFHFQCERFKIAIAKPGRSKFYTLWCEKWVPDYPPTFKAAFEGAHYGHFDTLIDALIAFDNTIRKCFNEVLDHPIKYIQLELY